VIQPADTVEGMIVLAAGAIFLARVEQHAAFVYVGLSACGIAMAGIMQRRSLSLLL